MNRSVPNLEIHTNDMNESKYCTILICDKKFFVEVMKLPEVDNSLLWWTRDNVNTAI